MRVIFSGTTAEVAERLSVSTRTVQRMATRSGSGVIRQGQNNFCLVSYAGDPPQEIEDSDADSGDNDVALYDMLKQDQTSTLSGSSNGFIDRQTYRYDIARDEYTFTVRRGGQSLLEHVNGSEIRDWFEYYTTPGVRVADVLRKYEIDRQTFNSIKNSLALTKSSLGFTDEELASRSKDDLIRSSLRKKERQIVTETNKKYQSVLESQAKKSRNAEELIRSALSSIDIPPVETIAADGVDEHDGYVLVVPIADYHIGKHSYANPNYCLDDQIEEYQALTAEIIKKSLGTWGTPSQVVYAMIGDFFHIDTDKQQTTSQRNNLGESMTCTATQMMKAGTEFAAWQIQQFHAAFGCDVAFYSAPGNHDRLLHGALSVFLRMMFQNTPWFVDGRDNVSDGEYYEESNHVIANIATACILFTHTDELNDAAAVTYLNRFRSRDVRPENCAVIGGDKHRLDIKDIVGIRRYICGSPSPIDSWHSSKGYVATRESTVFRVCCDDPIGISDLKIVRLPTDLSNSGFGRVSR